MQTNGQWWRSVVLTVVGAMSLGAGLLVALLEAPQGLDILEWASLLVFFGLGGLSWRQGSPEPATAADLALLTTSPAVARALQKEHQVRKALVQGIVIGLGILLAAAIAYTVT